MSRAPWVIAVRCAQCAFAEPLKPTRYRCRYQFGPAFMQTTWSDFGCVCGTPMPGAGDGLVPILNAEKDRVFAAMSEYIPTHGDDHAELSRKANKRTYMAQEFYEIRPDDPTQACDIGMGVEP